MKTSKKIKKQVHEKSVLQKEITVKTKIKTKIKAKVKMKQIVKSAKIVPKEHSSANATFGPVNVEPYYFNNNEDYMNQKQLMHFRTILLQWKEQLMKDVDYTVHHMQDDASNYPDPVDRASQEEEFNLELRTRDRERKLLKKIDETLMRINDEDYGYCDDCGAEIGIRRLEARPTTNQCIECKTISEIREKQIGEDN